jgi:hypothetical protein
MNFNEADKTPWFPGTVKPTLEGVYEREYMDDVSPEDAMSRRFSRYANGKWYIGHPTVVLAEEERHQSLYRAGDNDFAWRGLACDPSVVAADAPGLALDSGEFIPAAELNAQQPAVDEEEDLF